MIIDIESRKVKINEDILRIIFENRQLNSEDYESGGMLIGSIIRNSKDIVIEDLTLPIYDDIRSRIKYVRSDKHNEILEKKWIESQHTKMYFGEWHTHPQDSPIPSTQDIKNWKHLLHNSKTRTSILIFIIAGNLAYKVWIGDRNKKRIYKIYEGGYNDRFIKSSC